MEKKRRILNNAQSGEATPVLNVDDVMERFQQRMDAAADLRRQEEETRTQEVNVRLDAIDTRLSEISVRDAAENDPHFGFANVAEYLEDVREFTVNRAEPTDRFRRALNAVGSDEHATFSNPDGGFLIPAPLLGGELTLDPFAIQPDTGLQSRQIPMGNAQTLRINARVDKNHSTSVTGGFTVNWRGEAQTPQSSKTKWEQIELRVNGLDGLAYATDEQVRYAPMSIGTVIQAGFGSEWRSKLNDARIRGTGVGQFEGYLNSDALITVAKEGGQGADTINATNVRKMRARAYNYGQCAWMVNQDCYTELSGMHIAGTNSDQFIFVPGNGSDIPDTLLGRPVVYDENASTLGDKGDISLVNWNEYIEGQSGGADFLSSMHVRFLEAEMAYRFTVYVDGKSWWKSPLTPKKSAATLSPFVTLTARA